MKCAVIVGIMCSLPMFVSSADVIDPNVFAREYNAWATQWNHHTHRLDAREISTYLIMKQEFHRLQKQVDEEYQKDGYLP